MQRPGGARAILESLLPLDGKTAEGSLAPLNLNLHPHDGSFVPESSLVPVSIPTASHGQVAFPDARFGVRVAGGAPAAGEQSGGSVLYPNVGGRSHDTDALVRAVPTGADVSFLLRSHKSPQSRTMSFDLPLGWRLHDARDPAGSVDVVSGSGKVMGRVLAPLAVDAQGQTVRARYHILGRDQLKLTVFHNAGDYAYPILVDPVISTDYQTTSMYSNWEQASNDSANFTASDPSGYSSWKMGQETTYSAGQYGEYVYTPPAGAYVYELTESGVEHNPDKSEEYGGIWASGGGWESGTWQNLTNGNNGSTAERTTTGSLSGDDYEYCAHGGGPGVTCPAQPSSPITANNLAVFGLEATGGNEGSNNGADELSDATVYLSDTVSPGLTVSHSNYQQGHWIGSGGDYFDTVTATGSETSGLGMSELAISGPSGFTATPHPSKTWQCSTTVPNVSSGKPAPMPCPGSVNTSFTYSTSSLPEGQNALTVTATSAAGNTATKTWNILIDRTPPTASVACNQGTSAWSNAGSSTCTVTGSDPNNASNGSSGSGLQTLEYRTELNGGSWSGWTTVSSGAQFSVSAEGTTNVQAQAIDNAGNIYTTPSTTVELDRTAPNASLSCPGSGAWANTAVTCTVTGSDPVNSSNGSSGSGLQTLEYRTQLNGGSWSGWTTVSSGAQFSVSAEGTTNVQAQAIDGAGNNYTTPTTTVEIDGTPPSVSVSCPGSGTWSNAGSSTCTVTGSDPNNASNGSSGSGLQTLEYRTELNGGSWSGWTTVSSGAQFSVSAEGTTNVQAQAIDNAGNIYTTPSTTVELDRTAPNASLSCPGSGAWANTAVTCTVTGSDPVNSSNGSSGSGLQTLEYRTQLNGGSWSGWTTVSSGAQFSVSAEGTTNVQAQAIDGAGNNYTTPTTTVEIDGTPPSVSVSCPGSGTWSNAGSSTCTVTGSDPNNASNGSSGSGLQTLEYRTELNGGSWSGWTTVSSGAQFSVSAEGTTNVQAQAIDNAGNIYTTPSTTVELDRTAPTLTLSGTLANDNGQAVGPGQYPLDFTVQDGTGSTPSAGAATVTVTVDDANQTGVSFTPCNPGPCQGSGSWTLDTTNMSVGPHTIAVTATDGAGNTTTQNLSITIPPAGSGTQVSSNINADTTWTAAGSPYVLDANVHVDGGVTLTIAPGVTVEFNNGQTATFTVDGTLDSDGASGNPVTFISSQVASGSGAPGQYMGISVTSGSSQFSYTNFYYGGYGSSYNSYGELTVSGGSVSIDHSTFQDNQDSGLDVSGGAATVSYSKFENNGDGISGVGGAPGPLYLSHSTVANNASVGVFLNITSNSTTSSSLLYDTVTGNSSSGVELQEPCSNSPSSFPHGEWNNIYANNTGSGEIANQLATLNDCRALPVDWRNNYWGPDVYYYYNNSSCATTSDSFRGFLAYRWSQPAQYEVPSGPAGENSSGLYGTYPNYFSCGWNSFDIGPGQFQTSPIPDAGAAPGSGVPAPTGGWQLGGFPSWGSFPKQYCGDPVDCATGNLYETHTDLNIPGLNGGLTLTRNYNSQAAANQTQPGALGYGWTFEFGESLSLDPSGQDATVTNADGSEVTFTENADGSYSAPPWVQATLIKNQDGSYSYTLPDQHVYTFDATGELEDIVDRNGNTTSLAYNGSGELQTVTDASGRQLTFSYNSSGQIQQITDPANRTVQYGYDSAGNLTSVTDAGGGTWTYGYDGLHELTSITDPCGGVVSNTYNANQQVISQTDAMTRKMTWVYSSGDTQITDAAGNVTDEQFTGDLPTQITRGYGTSSAATTKIAYDANDNVSTVTDPNGHKWSYGYDSAGNQTSVTDPLSHTTTRTYDSQRDLTSVTLPSGLETSYGYDGHDNLTSVTVNAGSLQEQTTMSYGSKGLLTGVTDPLNRSYSYGYDAYGDRTSVTSPSGHETTATYDNVGRLSSVTTARGNESGANASDYTTTISTDAFGDPLKVTDPNGNQTTYTYNQDQILTGVTDRDGRTTQYTYDLANELTKITRGDGSALSYSYDPDGQLESQTDGLGHTTTYGRDPLERITSITDPLNRRTTIGYDSVGNQTSLTDPSSRTTTYTYNNANELTGISYSSANPQAIGFSYSSDGLPTQMTDESGSTSYSYDPLDRLESQTSGAGQTTTYGYNLDNELTSIGYPDALTPLNIGGNGNQQQIAEGTVKRTYNEDGNLASVADWLGNTTTFGYDAEGNLTSVNRPNGTQASYSYDTNDAMTALSDLGVQLSYGRSNEGLLSSTSGGGQGTTNYGYDGAQRLTSVGSENYTYDAADNLTQTNTPAGQPVTQSFDNANELASATQGQNSTTYSYDTDGNRVTATPTTGTTTTYSYNQANQLISYNGPDHTSTTGATVSDQYSYDGNGLRQTKTTNNILTNEAYDLSEPLPLMIEDGPTAYIYGPDGLPIEQIDQNGTPLYYSHDQLGSTTALTNQTGNTTATYTYDAYGNPTSPPPTGITTPFGYAGQYTDPETGLQYDRARYYDPSTGQLLTRDPAASITQEPYSYAFDGPVDVSDPSGLCGAGSVGDFLNSFNPFSSQNCAYQAAQDIAGAAGDAAGVVVRNARPIAEAAAAVLACATPYLNIVSCPEVIVGTAALNIGINDVNEYTAVTRGCSASPYLEGDLVELTTAGLGLTVAKTVSVGNSALDAIRGPSTTAARRALGYLNGLATGTILAIGAVETPPGPASCSCGG